MSLSTSVPEPRGIVGRRLDILRTLDPVARAIGLTRLTRAALLGFAAGAALGAAILIVAHFRAFDFALPAAIAVAVLGFLAGAARGVARWPRAIEAARAADLHFGLDDRLTTALELRGADTPVAFLQSHDLERQIDGLALTRCRGRGLRRSESGIVGLAALAFAGALALGPPGTTHHSVATSSLRSAKAQHAAAKQVQRLASQLHLGLTPAQLQSPAMRKLDAALARLRRQLLRASSARATLRSISATQQQLRQLAQGLHPVNSRAVAQLNSSLSRYLSPGHKANIGRSSAARSSTAMARALNRLARSLAHLTPAQRAALASALARTANSTRNDSLRQALRQAASALANGQPQSARAALQGAAQTLAQSSATQAARARAAAAETQLNAVRNKVAAQVAGTGAAPPTGPSSPGQGRPNAGTGMPGTGNGQTRVGTGAGRGQGTRPGQGRGAGQGRGQGQRSGQGQGQGQGNGQGQGTGRGGRAGQGRGTGTARGTARGRGNGQGQGRGIGNVRGAAGAHGAGGRGTTARTRSGKTVTVFVPGTQGKGSTITRTGPSGAPEPGALVPYQQVVGQYTSSAHQALDRSALPPSLQGYVRRYFSTLSR